MKLSIVIPFYNEENMIQKMYDALVKEINQITVKIVPLRKCWPLQMQILA